MNTTDENIFIDGVLVGAIKGAEWTDEMQTAVKNDDLQLTPGYAAADLFGLRGEEAKIVAPQLPAPAGRFSKVERATIRSVVQRKIQREQQQAQDDSCEALAEELREERKGNLGRPSEYTPEIGEQICRWIAGGKSLNKYCQHFGMGLDTVYRWLRTNDTFRDAYALAHSDRADLLADEIVDLLDDIDPENITLEKLALAKLKVETRKWMASKLKPARWGDKQIVQHDHGSGISINIGIPQKPMVEMAEEAKIKPPLLDA